MKSQSQILRDMSAIPRLARGRIGVMRQKPKGGGAFHNLQYTRGGRHHAKYVPEAQLAAYEEATANYRRFMSLVDEYVELMSAKAAREIEREVRDAGKRDARRKV